MKLLAARLLLFLLAALPVLRAAEIHDAADKGDTRALTALLDKDPGLIDLRDKAGDRPLHHAIQAKEVEAARLLIDKGADVDARGFDDWTPLHWAAKTGSKPICEMLLEHGANLNALNGVLRTPLQTATGLAVSFLRNWKPPLPKGALAFFQAAEEGKVAEARLLLTDDPGLLNLKDREGDTALLHAARTGHEEMAAFLVEQGADVSAADKNGHPALFWAVKKGYAGIVKTLLPHAKEAATSKESREALARMSVDASPEVAQAFAAAGLVDGPAPSSKPAEPEKPVAMTKAAPEPTPPPVPEKPVPEPPKPAEPEKPVAVAMTKAAPEPAPPPAPEKPAAEPPKPAEPEKPVAMVKPASEPTPPPVPEKPAPEPAKPAEPEKSVAMTKAAPEPMPPAAPEKPAEPVTKPETVEKSKPVEAATKPEAPPADPNARDASGNTRLQRAVLADNTTEAAALLKQGAKLGISGKNGEPVLITAVRFAGADMVGLLLDHGAAIDAVWPKAGYTPLMTAAWAGRLPALNVLIRRGASLRGRTSQGATALHIAAQYGRAAAIRALIRAGLRVDTTDGSGATPLIIAAATGQLEAVQTLLAEGANPNATANLQVTALKAARSARHEAVAAYLRAHGARE